MAPVFVSALIVCSLDCVAEVHLRGFAEALLPYEPIMAVAARLPGWAAKYRTQWTPDHLEKLMQDQAFLLKNRRRWTGSKEEMLARLVQFIEDFAGQTTTGGARVWTAQTHAFIARVLTYVAGGFVHGGFKSAAMPLMGPARNSQMRSVDNAVAYLIVLPYICGDLWC